MDLILIIIGIGCIIAGLAGALLPVLPGPPLSYAGLFLLQFTSSSPFGWTFMIVWAFVVIVIMVLDNLIPVYGAKRYGGSTFGVWGSMAGLVIGFFFPPVGIIIGPIIGAFLGELTAGKNSNQAMRAAWGSFLGFMAGTLLKIIAAGMMGYYFFTNI